MGIRSMLHPQPSPNITTTRLPRACYQMTNKEKESFLSILKNVKTPDECSSNIPRCVHVKQHKMFGLKSYDCHVLMQELLPVALRGSLPDKVTSVLVDLCNFFKQICSKVLNVEFLSQLESQIVITLCQLETIFPPSFFTVMMHLVIHLAHEAQVAGPVQYRWMYPLERFLLTLKSFVRNRAHPEGSIAEGFLANECLTFCSQYLSGVETRFNRPNRNDDEVSGRPLGIKKQQKLRLGKRKKVSRTKLDKKELAQAHRYVLSNCDAVAPFIEEAMARRRKLNIRHRASDNEGIQSTSNNTNSTNVEGSNVAETRSSPCHAEGVIRESVESHSIPSDIEVEEEQIEKEVEPKRARGPTKMLDVWEMEDGDLIIVNLDKYGRPIGEEGTTLTRFIGSVARRYQYAPINYKSWKVMPNDYKEEMLKLIESKFEFVPPINDLTREMLKSELNEKWRQWKGDLKSMAYDPTKTEEEVASLVPDDRVDPNQYRGLVHHWFSDEGQKISKINRQNRAKFEDVHCMGSKSLPKFIDEKIKRAKECCLDVKRFTLIPALVKMEQLSMERLQD
nr:uncharacterized protein LOC101493685 [Cicer arietinum]